MVGWMIFGVLMLVAVCWLLAGIGRTVETFRGHAKCSSCGARLAGFGLRYAWTCRKCGRDQPWAKVA